MSSSKEHVKGPLPEPHRAVAGHAGYADSAHPAMGSAARAWCRTGDSSQLGRVAADRTRIALPGIAPSGGAALDLLRVESVGDESPGKILPVNRGGPEAAR